MRENIPMYVLQASGVPSSSQVHGNKEEYQRLDFKNGAESKDKSSSTQGKSVEEYYSALGKSKVRKISLQ